jgi:hypothetical protein
MAGLVPAIHVLGRKESRGCPRPVFAFGFDPALKRGAPKLLKRRRASAGMTSDGLSIHVFASVSEAIQDLTVATIRIASLRSQ